MTLGWPWPILNLVSYAFIWGKLLESHLMEEIYSKWPEWQKVYVYIKILAPRGGLPLSLSRGLYTCIKTWKIMYKIRLRRYCLETCNKWAKWQGFSVDIRNLSTKGCLPLPRDIYMWKNIKKMCIKSEFKETCLKLATNGRSDKGFLLTSKVCSQGVFCPCPGAIYMYRII